MNNLNIEFIEEALNFLETQIRSSTEEPTPNTLYTQNTPLLQDDNQDPKPQ
jgi:hypothetical protein